MGMGERETFIATKMIDDKFIALDRQNNLTTWNTITGKVRQEINLVKEWGPEMDYSDFDVYSYRDDVD